MKVSVRHPVQSGAVNGEHEGIRTTAAGTEHTEAGARAGGGEDKFLAERTACDYPDNEISNE